MDNFEYEPIDLERPSIRLLRLLKGTNGSIQCELFNGWLYEEVIEYEALSYTWGGILKPREIELDGKQFPVTENLFLALEHLRHPYQDRILWIDAICIDQENLKERGHQVQQMGCIYSQAEQVVIWLGMSTLATDALMDSLQHLHVEHRKSGCAQWMPTDPRWLGLWMEAQSGLKKEYFDLENLQRKGLKTLAKRSWFKRVWILQEVANAKRATIYTGAKSVSSRIFGLVPAIMGVRMDDHVQAVLDIIPGPSRDHSWWKQNRELYTLLRKFKNNEATDERDMVYALIGISSDKNIHNLRPDYSKDFQMVIFNVGIYLFDMHIKLPFIRFHHLGRKDPRERVQDTWKMSEVVNSFPYFNAEHLRRSISSWTIQQTISYFNQRGSEIKVTREILEAAAFNEWDRKEIFSFLLNQKDTVDSEEKEDEVANSITKPKNEVPVWLHDKLIAHLWEPGMFFENYARLLRVLDATLWLGRNSEYRNVSRTEINASDIRKQASDIIILLLRQRRDTSPITEDLLVELSRVSAIGIFEFLLGQPERELMITERIIEAAAQNEESGEDIVAFLLNHPRTRFNITEQLVMELVRSFSVAMVSRFLEHKGRTVQITLKIIETASQNSKHGGALYEFLVEKTRTSTCCIEEEASLEVWNKFIEEE